MEPLPDGIGRGTRFALVAFALLALLGVVAVASRTGLGHESQAATPSPGYISYAFTAFLIVFTLVAPFAIWTWFISARQVLSHRGSFASRVVKNIAAIIVFSVLAYLFFYLRRHHHLFGGLGANSLFGGGGRALRHRHGAASKPYEPQFEWNVLWVTLAVLAAGAAYVVYRWRRRASLAPALADREPTVAEDFAASMGDAIDDLEAEPDARRAVIAAYARMEAVLARNGLERTPSETAVEYLRRVLLGLTSRGEAVQTLTALFEQAKFSAHEIDGAMKHDAIGALREIRADLQGETA